MTHARTMLGSAFALVILLGGLGVGFSNAQDQPIKRTELLRTDLAGIEGKEAVAYIADLAPGAVGGKHTHPGDEFVYVLEGALIVEPVGKEPFTLKPGETAHMPPTVVHAARNGSAIEPAKVLVVRSKRLVPKRLVNLTTRSMGWWCDWANRWEPSVSIAPLVFIVAEKGKPLAEPVQ